MTRLQRMRAKPDDGATLILVLMVSLMIVLLTATVATATISEIVPAKRTQDAAAATAAAEAGIDDFTAQINAHCRSAGACSWISGNPHVSNQAVEPTSTTTFSWQLVNPLTYQYDGYLRLVSTGRSPSPGQQTRTLVADFKGNSSFFDYSYVTQFETIGSSLINARFPARNILVDKAASIAAIGRTGASLTASWVAPAASGAGSPAVCDQYYYASALGSGRYHAGRINSSDWNQTGTAGGTGYVNYGQCEVAFGSGAVLDGPVYSRDAMLLSNGTIGGSGPTFKSRVDTYWGNATSDDPLPPQPDQYRSQASVGGSPKLPDSGSNAPRTSSTDMNLPDNVSDAPTSTRCTYVGPTRIRLTGDHFAIITSPQSTGAAPATDKSDCRANTDASVSGTGVVSAKVDMRGTTIYVQNNAVAPVPTTPIFKRLTTVAPPAVPASSDASVPTAAAQWVNPTSSPTCATATIRDQKRFDCLLAASYPDGYSGAGANSIVNKATSSFAASPGTDLASFVAPYVAAANSAIHSPVQKGDYRYAANTPAPASSTTSTTTINATITPDVQDPLLEGAPGQTTTTKTTTTTTTTTTVTGQVYGCYGLLNLLDVLCLGGTNGWGDGTSGGLNASASAFKITNVRTQISYSTAATQAASTFPLTKDVTQYSSQNGDAYIEGTQVGQSSIVTEGSAIVTGNLTYASNTADALDLVSLNHVRIYHPVQCAEQPVPAGTTTGFCPNDITGLYSSTNVPTDWTLHPSQQYQDIRSDLTNVSISAGLFSLGGSIYTDNYDRGSDSLGSISLRGMAVQLHRGAWGENWEIPTSSGASRKHTGYRLNFVWDSTLGARGLPYIPVPAGALGAHVWSVQSISTTSTLSAS